VQKQHGLAVGTDPGLAIAERSRNLAMGDASPSGWMNSILVLGRVTNTVMTPCSGNGTAAEISAPNAAP